VHSQALDGKLDGFEFFQHPGWNTYRHPDPDDIDRRSSIYHQLKWLETAGNTHIDVYFMKAGHALIRAWKVAAKGQGRL
jgi:tRNA (cmo5U34)-methyltransferase